MRCNQQIGEVSHADGVFRVSTQSGETRARALVIEPDVVLLDEPLSNLDAKLRVDMRTQIKEIHREIGRTMIYVTHDQAEALSMADRIAVMRRGRVVQAGTPRELYNRPESAFVAEFIGGTNLLRGTL